MKMNITFAGFLVTDQSWKILRKTKKEIKFQEKKNTTLITIDRLQRTSVSAEWLIASLLSAADTLVVARGRKTPF